MKAETGARPPLLVLLICEQALLDEAKTATLVRVIDTFNFAIETKGIPTEQIENISVMLRCMVFTRWGPGEGEFIEELVLVLPNGKEAPERSRMSFTKPAGFHFHQIRHEIALEISDPGTYAWRVYLGGEAVAEHPFRVNIERTVDNATTQPP